MWRTLRSVDRLLHHTLHHRMAFLLFVCNVKVNVLQCKNNAWCNREMRCDMGVQYAKLLHSLNGMVTNNYSPPPSSPLCLTYSDSTAIHRRTWAYLDSQKWPLLPSPLLPLSPHPYAAPHPAPPSLSSKPRPRNYDILCNPHHV